MAEQLTPQQEQAVINRGGKLLVSAAAGSGKTKVLVDRLLSYLTDPADPANIDDFLIITYTKAAAAELRTKIANKLSERILADPDNRHLQRQMQRLYMTQISTVHSFCTEVLREHAYRLDISGDFRVAEENECIALQAVILQQLLDEAYENAMSDPDFCTFMDTQGLGRDDRKVPELVLQVYKSAICHLDPEGWLDWCMSVNDLSKAADVSHTIWGKYLICDLHETLDLHLKAMDKCVELASAADKFEKVTSLLVGELEQLRELRSCETWDEIMGKKEIQYGRLNFPRNYPDRDLVERIKAVRNACKDGIAKKLKPFSNYSDRVLADLATTAQSARGLISLTRRFMEQYRKRKLSRRMLDFSDLEHITLDLLLGKKRTGPTAVAEELSRRFREVMVDEYQDSNEVQDAIFSAITDQRGNCFMVGDVKQSIYRFRLADPGIFLKKYNEYVPADIAKDGEGRKILLSKNFRSAGSVVDAVNDVFSICMSEYVGGLDYGPDEALEEGRMPRLENQEPEIELYAIDADEDSAEEEANFVAQRIRELLDGSHTVRDQEGFRPIQPEDIVILLRSPGSSGAVYAKSLEKRGIRCSFGGSVDILKTEEVQTLRAILQIIDNPLQDIPLITAMTSRVFGFTADDLAKLRSCRGGGNFYQAVCCGEDPKAKEFISTLKKLRSAAKLATLPQLLQEIFYETGIDSVYAAMPDGKMRTENLQGFCQLVSGFDAGGVKSLDRFLIHLEGLDEKGVTGAGEDGTAGAVTVMSIHRSKGLEFPVVFLCGLSRKFNREDAYEQVLCDRDLGLGLYCVDTDHRVRYPSVAKRAIAAKILTESLSEEMRVLYVAMTRPKDRLIMTYASRSLPKTISQMAYRMDISDSLLMTSDVNCPGKWILLTALHRSEAGALFQIGAYPENRTVSKKPWLIRVEKGTEAVSTVRSDDAVLKEEISEETIQKLQNSLSFRYPFDAATQIPSKQTATQLKGRMKDQEAAQDAGKTPVQHRNWRRPSFVSKSATGRDYGNATHSVMQYIQYASCGTQTGVETEIQRLVTDGFISQEQAVMVDVDALCRFFETEIGQKLIGGAEVIREFKFSILEDASKFDALAAGENILLQGVVDCAVIEPDGITVLDFKTDSVTDSSIATKAEHYRQQVCIYADALARIYQQPIKANYLYFFSADKLIKL